MFWIELGVEQVIAKLTFRGILHKVNASVWIGLKIFIRNLHILPGLHRCQLLRLVEMLLYLLVLLLQTEVELGGVEVFHRLLEVNWVLLLRLSVIAFILLGRHLHVHTLIASLERSHRVVQQMLVNAMIERHVPQLLKFVIDPGLVHELLGGLIRAVVGLDG